MYIHFLNSILMRPLHFYERGYAYAMNGSSQLLASSTFLAIT